MSTGQESFSRSQAIGLDDGHDGHDGQFPGDGRGWTAIGPSAHASNVAQEVEKRGRARQETGLRELGRGGKRDATAGASGLEARGLEARR